MVALGRLRRTDGQVDIRTWWTWSFLAGGKQDNGKDEEYESLYLCIILTVIFGNAFDLSTTITTLFIYIMMQSYYFFRKNEGKNSLIDR